MQKIPITQTGILALKAKIETREKSMSVSCEMQNRLKTRWKKIKIE